MSIQSLSLMTLLLLGGACTSSREARRSASPVPPPPSALEALVRSLEVLDGLQEESSWVHVRALQADSLIDRQANEEYVRLVLDLTVLARDLDHAHTTFDRIERALDAEARAHERTPVAGRERIERTFRDLDWSLDPPSGGPVFAQLVSVSKSVRLEVRAGRPRVALEAASGAPESATSEPLKRLLQETAARPDTGVGPLDIDPDLTHPWPGIDDVRMRVTPRAAGAGFERFRIGSFLQRLEAESPRLRVTHVDVHLADLEREHWTFAAEVVVRREHPAG